MLAALLQLPPATIDLVAAERQIQAEIPFLEHVEQIWSVDGSRIVAYISGVRQSRHLDCGKPGEIFFYGDYAYAGIWKLNRSLPTLLCRSTTIESEPMKKDRPVFLQAGDHAVFASGRAGADHYRTYLAAMDLQRNEIRTLYDDPGLFSQLALKNNVANLTLKVSGTRGKTKWSGYQVVKFKLN